MTVKAGHIFIPGLLLFFLLVPEPAMAETGEHAGYHLAGAGLSGWWVLPFAGTLLSIAVWPLADRCFWDRHFGKVLVFWAALFLLPCWLFHGGRVAAYVLLETMILEYLPFVILLLALFTISGGIRLAGSLVGTPKLNTFILFLGTVLASWMGTTGAAMLFIRPLLRANAHRRYRVHTIVFFIFLVANIGGSLTPLGDPPLFLGFLKGVTFFWTTVHLLSKTLFLSVALLSLFFVLDSCLYRREGCPRPREERPEPLRLEGLVNLPLLAAVVGLVLLSGLWSDDTKFNIWADIYLGLPDLTRDLGLLALTILSVFLTKPEIRRGNGFTWEPIIEVAKIFAGIFVTIVPAIAILRAGAEGALSGLVALTSSADGQPVNYMYFWLTGGLSSFLDNAPTYLVFFNLAGGDARHLMDVLPGTLAAISAGAVFMGATTYIGNAPNFMVRSIAEENGVKMPSFFGYMVWSMGILLPLFILVTYLFFVCRPPDLKTN
jgi:Na+/H+ antiporter NhaD/arsenite permease-like protein